MARPSHRKNRTLPRYSQHKATGRAYVVLPQPDGKRKFVYLGEYNSRESLEAYETAVGKWLAKQAPDETDNRLKVRDLAERYRSVREPHLNRDQNYDVGNTARLLCELYGDRPAAEFSALMFDRLKNVLVERGYSRAYGNRIIGYTKKMFRWGMQRDLIGAGQYTAVESVEPLGDEAPTKIVKPIDQQTVGETLPALSATLAAMVKFIRATGCRPGEARTMRVCDVDRQTWLLELKQHKTAHKGKARFIVIPPEIRNELLPRLLRPADRYVFSPDPDGKRAYEKRCLGRAIDRAVKTINKERKQKGEQPLQHWHPYQLRHARAVEVREQFGVEVAQVLLGHSRVSMTEHYARLTREKAAEVSKLFG